MTEFRVFKFPRSRIATIDVFGAGKQKHHIAALIETDVTDAMQKIDEAAGKISFTSWLIKVISHTIKGHERVAAYRFGKQGLMVFDDINVSLMIEKEVGDQKIPIPLLIEKASDKSVAEITRQIRDAKQRSITKQDIVLQRRTTFSEKLYYVLPGPVRRTIWRYLLRHPRYAYLKMGNVGITSIGMMGKVSGWFIPSSVHPVSFGIGSVIRKPIVINNEIAIRDMLNMTVLLDHDVVDGAPMARFINELSGNIENGVGL
jgi:pyruvate/2-oxoglutarate dehydrogenase complex dihydrolipoamide acyltransferase (E2) component